MNRGQVWIVLVLLLLSVPGPLAHAAGSVAGQVDVILEDGMMRTMSVKAVAESDDGTASGLIALDDPTPLPDQDVDGTGDPLLAASPSGVRLYAQVSCLAIDGDVAIVGGEVV